MAIRPAAGRGSRGLIEPSKMQPTGMTALLHMWCVAASNGRDKKKASVELCTDEENSTTAVCSLFTEAPPDETKPLQTCQTLG